MNSRLWIFLLAASAWARQDTAQRVTLDVVANDKSGRPVSGLTQQDFTVSADKQAQPILSFDAKADPNGGEVVIVMDAVNTDYSRVAYARQQVEKFLQQDGGRLSVPISVAFFTDKGLKMQESTSQDGNALKAEIEQNVSGLRTIGRTQGFYGAADRSGLSLQALNELVAFEAKRPGRKIVIWVSPGWPLLSNPMMDLSEQEERRIFATVTALSTQLRQSRIVLYDVNPLGTDESLAREDYYLSFTKGARKEQDVHYGDVSLQVLSVQSGGRVLDSSNDLPGELQQCVRDLKNSYEISFAALPAESANSYHPIEVKINQPGVKAQTRSGYYSQPQ